MILKENKYKEIIPKVKTLIDMQANLIANLSNITAALKQEMNYFWVGFYFAEGDQLMLGPFQGPPACTRIPYGKGVCGACWMKKETIIVDDVHKFPGHIACSAESKSEIVLPVFNPAGSVAMVLDIDSDKAAAFDDTDKKYLQQIVLSVEKML